MTMLAVACPKPCKAEELKLVQRPLPQPGPKELLIRVHATTVNRLDLLQRRGFYPPPKGVGDILGMDISGEVVGMGKEVETFQLGERVFGLIAGEAYAQYACIDSKCALRLPSGLSFEEGAAIPEVFLTADETVFGLGKLQEGQTLLLHAGASGVGTAALQLAKKAGAKVIVTVGSEEKLEKTQALGADFGVNYKEKDFAEEVKAYAHGKGVDVVEDFVGAPYLEKNLSLLKAGGSLVLVGVMGGIKAQLDLGLILRQRLRIVGSVMRSRSLEEKRNFTENFHRRWGNALAKKEIFPIIHRIFPLEEVSKAHLMMESNQNFGKIVLKVPQKSP